MKFRKNSTHEFYVTDTLGLGADCLHKVPLFGFVRFLSENSLHSKYFHSRSQPAIRNFCSVLAVQNNAPINVNPVGEGGGECGQWVGI